jgi:hypothetical protein
MRTSAGASIISVVEISDGSRGMFDWVCRPSGSATFKASRRGVPACAEDDSTIGVISAFGRRACA